MNKGVARTALLLSLTELLQFLVVGPCLAVMNGCLGIVVDDFAAADSRIHNPVIAAVHPVFDAAF